MYYKCKWCDMDFELSKEKEKLHNKQLDKPLFCSLQCSGKYYAKKSHEIPDEQKLARNKKISQTLKNKESTLTPEQLALKIERLNSFWKDLTPEQRSKRNKENAKKCKITKQLRYGNSNYNNSKKARQTWSKKYNCDNPTKRQQHLSKEILEIIHNKNLLKTFIEQIPYDNRYYKYIADKLGISDSYCNTLVIQYGIDKEIAINKYVSRPEKELRDFIESIYIGEVITNTRNVIYPKELDIYIPDKKVAIEFNGAYYHREELVGKTYHYDKSVACENLGIRLIHIWDYEWENERQQPILKNIIKNALNINDNKVYARNTKIKVLNTLDVKNFFEQNNIQGFRGGKFAICLVDKYSNEVLMSYIMGDCYFGKGKYEWEVIRGATKLGYTIIGGASKIWKYFIETYKPNNCVYYIDYNYFNGNSLPYLGLQYVTTQPSFKNYWFEHWKTKEHNVVKNREASHHKEVMEAFKEGKGFSIANAGTKVYKYEK